MYLSREKLKNTIFRKKCRKNDSANIKLTECLFYVNKNFLKRLDKIKKSAFLLSSTFSSRKNCKNKESGFHGKRNFLFDLIFLNSLINETFCALYADQIMYVTRRILKKLSLITLLVIDTRYHRRVEVFFVKLFEMSELFS